MAVAQINLRLIGEAVNPMIVGAVKQASAWADLDFHACHAGQRYPGFRTGPACLSKIAVRIGEIRPI